MILMPRLKPLASVFWAKGFSGTSLDDLSGAMGMNRPSIYRAFGDKEEIYRQALNQFGMVMDEAFAAYTLAHEKDFRTGLKKVLSQSPGRLFQRGNGFH